MKNRAERIARWLESNGWDVYGQDTVCTKNVDHDTAWGGKYCPQCGAKTEKKNRKVAIDELEAAIAYALGETNKVR